jgi:hypothetical protein
MTDDELVAAFESGRLDEFPHELHVRTAWCYLKRAPILVALPRFRAALQRFAAGKGKPDRYHETITVAYMLLIAERLRDGWELEWPAFAARHADLLRRQPSALSAFYPDDVLASDGARRAFVLPGVKDEC